MNAKQRKLKKLAIILLAVIAILAISIPVFAATNGDAATTTATAETAVEAAATTADYIRVTDNGCGIPKEQVKEAFLRHATSKLSQIEDLEHLYTMGFRGEALASIAAVSQVEMTTRTKDEETGTRIEISAGEVKSFQDVACTEGTTVIVRNLFYNVLEMNQEPMFIIATFPLENAAE